MSADRPDARAPIALDAPAGAGDGEIVGSILPPDTSLLDLVDNLLSKGLLIHGELVLGLAGVDLVYLGISVVVCASDKLLPPAERRPAPPLRSAMAPGSGKP